VQRLRYEQLSRCPTIAEFAQNRATSAFRKNNFDGTKLPLEPSRSKTTTYGMKSLFHLFSMGQSCISHLTFASRLVIQKSHSHINRSLGNWMRVASARFPLEVLCPSVILKTRNFEQRSQTSQSAVDCRVAASVAAIIFCRSGRSYRRAWRCYDRGRAMRDRVSIEWRERRPNRVRAAGRLAMGRGCECGPGCARQSVE
jgi:hypothetical protein